MSALIWLAVVATYVVGLFPALVRMTRLVASEHAYCHREPRYGSAYKWGRSNCNQYDVEGCWRTDETPRLSHLLWSIPLSLMWPLTLIGVLALGQAAKTRPDAETTAAAIKRLEDELRMDGAS